MRKSNGLEKEHSRTSIHFLSLKSFVTWSVRHTIHWHCGVVLTNKQVGAPRLHGHSPSLPLRPVGVRGPDSLEIATVNHYCFADF